MVEPKMTAKEAQESKEKWEREGRPKPETSVEKATREMKERGFPLPTRPDTNDYLRELYKIYDQLVREGAIYPGDRDEYWERTYDYIQQHGLTPALPYYKKIQTETVEAQFGKDWGDYQKLVLEYGGTYRDKLSALVEAYPWGGKTEGGDQQAYRQIKEAVLGSLSPEERQDRLARTEARWREPEEALPAPYAPTTGVKYGPAFEEMRVTLGGPQPWRDWFERMYGTLIRRYKGAAEKPTEVGWAEYLKEQRARLREEWSRAGAYGRGERPAAFQPKIRTVAF